mmetsp:Transcript_30469/g.84042  ORF Transcript_30469/g.84042 Transcript_30469/m.84042 type:complete len:151 (-) Transcript_30469:150-602(-)|eukprot:CAMPEP_0179102316 /NCGR_PEP_ID=MMETSP0796-20121207/47350_1 /TAXON_ID=73915 /ORGANISM="Pyrodinium bahamense, Strain pbaha01" /LENGTH=150 /DNA_ID=CAMNT_0020800189 /DNA_START=129 /DNA_END=581 /DNA_ORIENTATION=+
MGATVCRTDCCDASGNEEVRPRCEYQNEGVVSASQLATDEGSMDGMGEHKEIDDMGMYSTTLVDLKQLQGTWLRQADGVAMGEIVGNQVIWDPSYQHAPSKLSLVKGQVGVPSAADLEMELSGDKHWGRYEGGEECRVIWSDGEVWVQMN